MNPSKSVRERLIDAGERLFAEHGWNGVGIRTIAAEAKVSLAALNYHFGAKETLLAEIFAARAKPIADERMRLLRELQARRAASLEDVIEAFLRPALASRERSFVKLRARLAIEPEAFSRAILARAFDASGRAYIEAMQALLPGLAATDLAWRFHFLLGAMVYTMADPGRIQSLTDGLCNPGDGQAALVHLVPFLAAGFRAGHPPQAQDDQAGGQRWTQTSSRASRRASPARRSTTPLNG